MLRITPTVNIWVGQGLLDASNERRVTLLAPVDTHEADSAFWSGWKWERASLVDVLKRACIDLVDAIADYKDSEEWTVAGIDPRTALAHRSGILALTDVVLQAEGALATRYWDDSEKYVWLVLDNQPLKVLAALEVVARAVVASLMEGDGQWMQELEESSNERVYKWAEAVVLRTMVALDA